MNPNNIVLQMLVPIVISFLREGLFKDQSNLYSVTVIVPLMSG